MEKNEISEEVTTTPLVRDLERLVNKGWNGVKLMFVFILTRIQIFIAFCFQYFFVFLIVALIGGALGFFSTSVIPREFAADLELKLNIDSKEQLKNDIKYLNALMHLKDKTAIADLMQVSLQEAEQLKGVSISSSSNVVEKTIALNEMHQGLDTSLFRELSVSSLISEGDNALSSKFRVTIITTDQLIFNKIEKPLIAYLERVSELQVLLEASQNALNFQKKVFEEEMAKIDTFSLVMNQAVLAQAQNGAGNGGDTYISFDKRDERSSAINTLDLQDRKIFYAQKIAKINLSIKENETCYFVTSHLNGIGEKIGLGPLMRGLLTAFFFFAFAYLFLSFRSGGKKAA